MTVLEELQKEVDSYKDSNPDLASLLVKTISLLNKQNEELQKLRSTKRVPVASVKNRPWRGPSVEWIGNPPAENTLLYIIQSNT